MFRKERYTFMQNFSILLKPMIGLTWIITYCCVGLKRKLQFTVAVFSCHHFVLFCSPDITQAIAAKNNSVIIDQLFQDCYIQNWTQFMRQKVDKLSHSVEPSWKFRTKKILDNYQLKSLYYCERQLVSYHIKTTAQTTIHL